MKKISLVLLSSTVGLFLLFVSVPKVNAVVTSVDQSCSGIGADYDLISPLTTPREQSFRPTQNRLEMVNIMVDGPGFNYDQSVWIRILDGTTRDVVPRGGYEFSPSFPDGPGYRTAEFNPALILTPGKTYIIQVDVDEGPSNLFWYYNQNDNCYPNGTATSEFTQPGWDFNFQTIGYNFTTTTIAPPTTAPATVAPTTMAATATTVPKKVTSTAIKTPTEPKAVYNESTKAVDVSWKASATADIDGYIVTRSEDNKTFIDLGMVKKDVLIYSDVSVVAEKTYYYQVKAYKGAQSSVVSATVSASTPKLAVEKATTTTTKDISALVAEENTTSPDKKTFFLIIGGVLAALLAMLLAVLIYLRKKKGLTLSKLFKRKTTTEEGRE